MATHSSILALQATVHKVAELDMTEVTNHMRTHTHHYTYCW